MNSKTTLRMVAIVTGMLFGLMSTSASAIAITLKKLATTFNNPVGIDNYTTGTSNSVVISVNYPNSPSGSPNFEIVQANGTHVQFSKINSFTEEVKIATVRPGNPHFPAGTLFTGNGLDGQIVRINPDGTVFANPWATLTGDPTVPGPHGLLRGSLYVDRTNNWGENLIVVTTTGEIWEIPAFGGGDPIFHANAKTHLEGLITVPNDPVKYGPLAGNIIAGAEDKGKLFVFDTSGVLSSFDIPVNIEDIDLIEPNGNFYGVNFGTGALLGASASDFAPIVGDILLTQEFHGAGSGLFRLFWDGTKLITEELQLSPSSAAAGQWEHVTISTAGIDPFTTTVPEPATVWLLLVPAIFLLGSSSLQRG